MGAMKISVIIPTHNRALLLRQCLEHLAIQTVFPDEVLVVDNASSDSTKTVAESFVGRLPIRYLFEPRRGPSFARNRGAREAKGDILGFLDDDQWPDKNWVAEAKKICRGQNMVVTGNVRYRFRRNDLWSQVFQFRIGLNRLLLYKLSSGQLPSGKIIVHSLDSGNFCLAKKVLSSLDVLFDGQLFPRPAGEQQDLSERLQLAGFKIVYDPKLVTRHQREAKRGWAWAKASFYWGRDFGIIKAKYGAPAKLKRLFQGDAPEFSRREEISYARRRLSGLAFLLFLFSEAIMLAGEWYGWLFFKVQSILGKSQRA